MKTTSEKLPFSLYLSSQRRKPSNFQTPTPPPSLVGG
ncbi:hypothetical protein SOVF_130870 [Spinacia oleracea]|nr:hypothetical protein SOVF_130870 [Spinacia oleracea]